MSDEANRRLMGTADFVAPEQAINSQNVDASADIYALGCTAFYLLSGRPPFAGRDIKQRLARHQTAEIPDVREFRKDCPQSLGRADPANDVQTSLRSSLSPPPTLLGQLQRLGTGSQVKPDHIAHGIKPASDTDLDDVHLSGNPWKIRRFRRMVKSTCRLNCRRS